MIIEILGVIMENLENAILDVGKNAFQKKKLEKDFLENAVFIAALEKPRAISTQSENETLFADKIAAVFSEENMREIYLSLKEIYTEGESKCLQWINKTLYFRYLMIRI